MKGSFTTNHNLRIIPTIITQINRIPLQKDTACPPPPPPKFQEGTNPQNPFWETDASSAFIIVLHTFPNLFFLARSLSPSLFHNYTTQHLLQRHMEGKLKSWETAVGVYWTDNWGCVGALFSAYPSPSLSLSLAHSLFFLFLDSREPKRSHATDFEVSAISRLCGVCRISPTPHWIHTSRKGKTGHTR